MLGPGLNEQGNKKLTIILSTLASAGNPNMDREERAFDMFIVVLKLKKNEYFRQMRSLLVVIVMLFYCPGVP